MSHTHLVCLVIGLICGVGLLATAQLLIGERAIRRRRRQAANMALAELRNFNRQKREGTWN